MRVLLLLFIVGSPFAAKANTPFPNINSSSKFLVYYGPAVTGTALTAMETYDVVVLHPSSQSSITPEFVATLKNAGVKYVLGYISIGEDASSPTPLAGDGKGPVYKDITTGTTVYENQGVASFYMDQFWTITGTNADGSTYGQYVSDNAPDTNIYFHGYFINPTPEWRTVINDQRISATGRSVAGLAQLVGTRVSDTDASQYDNFGFDGFFLDTLDTSGPYDNTYGYYSWTAQAMSETVAYIHSNYPNAMVLANRGFHFYNPDITSMVFHIHPYDYNIRPYINGEMFESYCLDSDPGHTGLNPSWNTNCYDAGRKITAEGNRPDGFTIFSLDYAAGRGTTLYDQAINESIVKNGWTEYLAADGAIDTINTYTRDHMPAADTAAPVWGTTGTPENPVDPLSYPPRVGVQAVESGPTSGDVLVQWDLALDQTGPVKYNIYTSGSPSFATSSTTSNVAFTIGTDWSQSTLANFANQYNMSGLAPGAYFFRVRAQDLTAGALVETNTNTLEYTVLAGQISNSGTTGAIIVDGTFGDWAKYTAFGTKPSDITGVTNAVDWQNCGMANDAANFYLAYQNYNTVVLNAGYSTYIDTDNSRTTGFRGGGDNFPVGAEYVVQGNSIYKYTGSGTDWSWSYVGACGSATSGSNAELSIPRSYLGNPTNLHLFFYGDNGVFGGSVADYYPMDASLVGGGGSYFTYNVADVMNPVVSGNITVDGTLGDWATLTSFGSKAPDVSGTSNPVDWASGWMAHDLTNFYLAIQNANSITLNSAYNIYLDTDANHLTGFHGGAGNFPVGAEYLIQGTSIYHYTGNGTSWSWSSVGSVTSSVSGTNAELSFARSLIGDPQVVNLFFYGDNPALGGTGAVVDYYPVNAIASNGTGKFFTYRTDEVRNLVSSAAITVDGTLSDWNSLLPYPIKQADTVAGTDPIDWIQSWVAHDNTNFCIAFQNQNAVTLNWGYGVFIDTDSNRGTGFVGSSNNFPIGAEYMIQGNTLYQYTGSGTDWSWSSVATLTTGVSGSNVELSFAKSAIGNPGLFRLFFYGDNSAFGGTVLDTLPINALNVSGTGGYLTYRAIPIP